MLDDLRATRLSRKKVLNSGRFIANIPALFGAVSRAGLREASQAELP